MKKNKKGFSLIELIAVIIIIGLVGLISIPVVSYFINDSEEKTYKTYENSMAQAANNQVVKCVSDASFECRLPESVDGKQRVPLTELIENGFIDNMKNPDSDEFCDAEKSYVEITKTGTSDYAYAACLQCGDYKTDGVCSEFTGDGDSPVCGTVTGASTRWTNQDRTISVRCSDSTSGCEKESFSKTFTTTMTKGNITIYDRSGKMTICPVDVYIDKTEPTCNLEVIRGDYISSVGWYSLDAEVKLKGQSDGESGVLTYGIGTSLENRNYNKEETITVGSGITTVLGYVKDNAGNEGVCGLDVKVGTSVPKFRYYYGYQIYPNKENYVLNQITEQTGNRLKTTGTNPTITLDRMSHYGQIEKVIVTLGENITSPTKASVLSNGTLIGQATMLSGKNVIEINVPKNNYNALAIKLGELSNKTYKVSKIEVLTSNGDTITNKDVTLYIEQQDEGMKTTEASYNNGISWQEELYKVFESNTTNIAKTRNKILMESEGQTFKITGIDKVVPAVKLTVTKKISGTVVTGNTWSDEELNYELEKTQSGISGYKIYYCKDDNNTCTPTIEVQDKQKITSYNTTTGEYYFRYKIVGGSGNESTIGSYHAKVDTNTPTVVITATKKTSGATVANDTWSDDYLNFKLTQSNVGESGATIYFCKDNDNKCTPATKATNNASITNYNATNGEYYIRYRIVSGAGKESAIGSYHAKVDANAPTVTITATKKTSGATVASNTWSDDYLNYKFSQSNVGGSGATIYFCKDDNNTCTPSTIAANNAIITNYNTISGEYYIRYKIVNGVGKESTIGSYHAKVDVSNPTCEITTSGSGTTVTLTVNGNSSSGIASNGYSWTSATSGFSSTKTKTINSNGTYSAWVKSNSGKVGTCSINAQVTCPPGHSKDANGICKFCPDAYPNSDDGYKDINHCYTCINHCPGIEAYGYCLNTYSISRDGATPSYGNVWDCVAGTSMHCYNGNISMYSGKVCADDLIEEDEPICRHTPKDPKNHCDCRRILSTQKCKKYANGVVDCSSSAESACSRTDYVIPAVSIVATKKVSGDEVPGGTWSNEGLNYRLSLISSGTSGATIYYCTDTNNTCIPTSLTTANNAVITEMNNMTGIYYVRYRAVSGTGNTSVIGSFEAKVDLIAPTCGPIACGADSETGVDITFACNDTGGSECKTSSYTLEDATETTEITFYDNAGNSVNCSQKVSVITSHKEREYNQCTSGIAGCIDGHAQQSVPCASLNYNCSAPTKKDICISCTVGVTVNHGGTCGCTCCQSVTIPGTCTYECVPGYIEITCGTGSGCTNEWNEWSNYIPGSCPQGNTSNYECEEKSIFHCGEYDDPTDENSPTCTVTKTSTGSKGVDVRIDCYDDESGCVTSSWTETGLKSDKTFTVHDNYGNAGTCSVTVNKTETNCHEDCYSSSSCGGWEEDPPGTLSHWSSDDCSWCNGTVCDETYD